MGLDMVIAEFGVHNITNLCSLSSGLVVSSLPIPALIKLEMLIGWSV